METQARILPKVGNLRDLVPNRFQRRVLQYVEWMIERGIPVRIIIYKPRQKGSSTITVALLYWFLRRYVTQGLIVGGQKSQAQNLWAILKRYHAHDGCDWGNTGRVGMEVGSWDHGSTLAMETAGDDEAARSGTYQAVVVTEMARWKDRAAASASDVLSGILNCVPMEPGTFVAEESTVRGGIGLFPERYARAVSFEQMQRGIMGSGYLKVFSPFYEHADSYVEPSPEELDEVLAGRGALNEADLAEERMLMSELGCKPGHILWRRRTIKNECDGDPVKFDRDFPATEQHGFRSTNPGRFNLVGLGRLADEARQTHIDWGVLEDPDGSRERFQWRTAPSAMEGDFAKVEQPREGLRYLVAVDNMTGISKVEGEDPDCHAVLALRTGYMDRDRGWTRPRVVAAIKPEVRVDIDILADITHRLARHYGDCMVVPEANNDSGLILELRRLGATVYQRRPPKTARDPDRPQPAKFGFLTKGGEHDGTRRWIIENLARAIREITTPGEGVEVPFPWIIRELRNFIVTASGRAEAAPGHHDDWVLALAIGLACQESATTYVRERIVPSLPPDLRALEDADRPTADATYA